MDFSQNRGRVTPPPAPTNVQEAPAPGRKSKRRARLSGLKILWVVLLFSATILVVALLLYIRQGGGAEKLIKKNQYQAVFLNGGQVYFGRLSGVDTRSIRITDIFYLRVNQQVQPDGKASTDTTKQDISLAKLGSELHGPEDEMIINRDQVLFWENLKNDGQVAKAIVEYKKNPTANTAK